MARIKNRQIHRINRVLNHQTQLRVAFHHQPARKEQRIGVLLAPRQRQKVCRRGGNGQVRLLVGGVLTYVGLLKVGADWPKWLRFSLVIAGGGGLAYILAKFADIIWGILMSLLLLAILWGVGSWIWKAV